MRVKIALKQIPFKVNWELYSIYDLIVLLLIYSFAFFFLWKFLDLSLGISLTTSGFITLIILFGITAYAMKKQELREIAEKNLMEEEEERNIREEYQKVYRLKKREELLSNFKCSNYSSNKLLIVEPEEDEFELIIHNDSSFMGVHFDYLNGIGPSKKPELNPKGQNFRHIVDEDKKK